jgi:outer membrane immunogenic protein
MLRKISILSSLLLASPCFSGFYVGASVGPEGAVFSQKSHVTRPADPLNPLQPGSLNVVDKEHFAGMGVFGSLFAGYARTYNRYYLAGEININSSSVKYQLVNDEYAHSTFAKTYFNLRYSEGVSLLPGYLLSENTLVYARIGYMNGKLKIVESDPTIMSSNKNRSGIRYGLGMQHSFTPRLALRMDYSQVSYQSVNSNLFEPFGMVTKTTKITPTTAQVGFGLIYSFDDPKVYSK